MEDGGRGMEDGGRGMEEGDGGREMEEVSFVRAAPSPSANSGQTGSVRVIPSSVGR
ncbi:hypothetical protein DIM_16360 [Candidatus Denitrolinea symbiosum]|nr:hypothetical protein DIM_16360 [Candidatus Denitrolinea symbiosum]